MVLSRTRPWSQASPVGILIWGQTAPSPRPRAPWGNPDLLGRDGLGVPGGHALPLTTCRHCTCRPPTAVASQARSLPGARPCLSDGLSAGCSLVSSPQNVQVKGGFSRTYTRVCLNPQCLPSPAAAKPAGCPSADPDQEPLFGRAATFAALSIQPFCREKLWGPRCTPCGP